MVALIILGAIALVITLIMLVPVGADVGYESGELRLSAKVCGMLLQLLPKPPADESKPPKKKKPKKEKTPKAKKPEGEAAPKKKLSFNRDELLGLLRAVLKGFGRFGRKLNVDRFLLRYTAAGSDPYDTAMEFAYVNAALSGLAPICRKRFDVKDCRVRTDVDFTAEKTAVDFGLAVTIRVGQIFGVIFTIIFGALGILIKNKLRLAKEKRQAKKAGKEKLITIEDIKQENTQAEERMDSNG